MTPEETIDGLNGRIRDLEALLEKVKASKRKDREEKKPISDEEAYASALQVLSAGPAWMRRAVVGMVGGIAVGLVEKET